MAGVFCAIVLHASRGSSQPTPLRMPASVSLLPLHLPPTGSPHSGVDVIGEHRVLLRAFLSMWCSYPGPHLVVCGACILWERYRAVSQAHAQTAANTHAIASCDPGRNSFYLSLYPLPHPNNTKYRFPVSVRTTCAERWRTSRFPLDHRVHIHYFLFLLQVGPLSLSFI